MTFTFERTWDLLNTIKNNYEIQSIYRRRF